MMLTYNTQIATENRLSKIEQKLDSLLTDERIVNSWFSDLEAETIRTNKRIENILDRLTKLEKQSPEDCLVDNGSQVSKDDPVYQELFYEKIGRMHELMNAIYDDIRRIAHEMGIKTRM